MANTIRIKRRLAGGGSGAPTSLANAELAFNEQDSILYYGVGTGGAGGTATSILAIAGPGAFATLGTTQTFTGDKTFSGNVILGSNATATTPSSSDNSTTVATTAYVKAQGYGTGTVTSVGLSLPNIFTVTNSPVTSSGTLTGTLASQTANYVWASPNGSSGLPTFRALVSADIPSLTASKISDFDTQVRTSRLDQMAAPTASVSLNSQKITNLATPTADSDAATKSYVDAARAGLDVKASVRLASTANVSVTYSATGGTSGRGQITAAPNSLDSVNLAANDRILLKNQTSGAQNGIWVVTTLGTGANGVWDRASDFDEDSEVTAGAFTFIEEGTVNADTGWVLITNNPIIIGGNSGTALTFAQFSGSSAVSSFSAGTTGFTPNTATTGAITLAGTLAAANGGTGVNNGSNTITLGGNVSTGGALTFSGAFGTTFTVTATTSVTLPTSGTLLGDSSTIDGGTF